MNHTNGDFADRLKYDSTSEVQRSDLNSAELVSAVTWFLLCSACVIPSARPSKRFGLAELQVLNLGRIEGTRTLILDFDATLNHSV